MQPAKLATYKESSCVKPCWTLVYIYQVTAKLQFPTKPFHWPPGRQYRTVHLGPFIEVEAGHTASRAPDWVKTVEGRHQVHNRMVLFEQAAPWATYIY